jgi:hypothetical protein
MISCQKSIGIENNSRLYHQAKVNNLTKYQKKNLPFCQIFEREFCFWMKWFGKSYTDFQVRTSLMIRYDNQSFKDNSRGFL